MIMTPKQEEKKMKILECIKGVDAAYVLVDQAQVLVNEGDDILKTGLSALSDNLCEELGRLELEVYKGQPKKRKD